MYWSWTYADFNRAVDFLECVRAGGTGSNFSANPVYRDLCWLSRTNRPCFTLLLLPQSASAASDFALFAPVPLPART